MPTTRYGLPLPPDTTKISQLAKAIRDQAGALDALWGGGITPELKTAINDYATSTAARAPFADTLAAAQAAQTAAAQSATDAQTAAASLSGAVLAAQTAVADADAAARDAAAAAALVGAPAGDVMDAYAIAHSLAPVNPGLAPLYVQTTDQLGSYQAPAGVRAGLDSTMWTNNGSRPNGQGYKNENIVTGVTGARGDLTLTVDQAGQTVLAVLVSGQANPWDAAVVSADGTAFFVTVTAWTASTVTVLRPLPVDVTGGQLASRIDSVGGQHLTSLGYKALAQLIARFSPLVGTRGGILEGCWDTRPQTYGAALWTKNAALAAYGEVNSNDGGTVVRSYVQNQGRANPYVGNNVLTQVAPFTAGSGIYFGALAAGHGVAATVRPARPAVAEFWTHAARDNASNPAAYSLTVTATNIDDGSVIYSRTVDGVRAVHRIPLTKARAVRLEVVANTTPVYVNVSQTTIREAGTGQRVGGRKIVLLGDSWTQFADFMLGAELQRVLGQKVITHGYGGMTTDYGLDWWDQYVRAERPDTVIIHFYTNDLNNLQAGTYVSPDGSTKPVWPAGLTAAQSEARWISNINKMIALAQADGIRPVVIMPGAVNVNNQLPAAAHLETPPLVDWSATAAELADPAAYLNTTGKRTGAAVRVGLSTKYAQGPAPADPWTNPTDTAVQGMQKNVLRLADYNKSTAKIGIDSNGDGLSDGLAISDAGANAGSTATYSIVAGAQRQAVTYGNTGSLRYSVSAPVTAGRDYLAVYDVTNATPGLSFAGWSTSTLSGTSVAMKNDPGAQLALAAGATTGRIFYRTTATATATGVALLAPNNPGNGGSTTWDARAALVIDLTALFADAPNLASLTNAELADFVLSLK